MYKTGSPSQNIPVMAVQYNIFYNKDILSEQIYKELFIKHVLEGILLNWYWKTKYLYWHMDICIRGTLVIINIALSYESCYQ